MHGTAYANHATMESDLIIAIGARFDDRVTGRVSAFAPHAKIVHIDIDPTSISKTVRVDVPIVGDAKNVLGQLREEIKKKPDAGKWLEQIKEWKARHPLRYRHEDDKIKPQFVIEQIYEATKGEAIIVTEVGQNQMWSCQWYKYSSRAPLSPAADWGLWGLACPRLWGRRWALRKRRSLTLPGMAQSR